MGVEKEVVYATHKFLGNGDIFHSNAVDAYLHAGSNLSAL